MFIFGTYRVRKVMLMFTSKYLLEAARMTLCALMNRPSAASVMSSREWEVSRAESLDTRSRGWSDHSTCILVTGCHEVTISH